jgi:flagellin
VNQNSTTFSASDARDLLKSVDNAINGLNEVRTEFGTTQKQLESSSRNLLTQQTSTLNAASLFDTDYAKESSNFSKQNILAQIGAYGQVQSTSVNQQNVLRLLS